MAAFVWLDKNWACKATYNILESNSMLDQFEEFLLRFADAGEFKLRDLPYARGSLSASDLAGRADQMSRKFFFYLLKHYTNRAERPSDTYQKVHRAFTEEFASSKGTFRTLAEQVDGFFKGDKGMSRTWTQAMRCRLCAALIAGLLAGPAARAQGAGAGASDGPATAASGASAPAKAASAPKVFNIKVGTVDGANKTGATLAAMYAIDWSKEWNAGGTPLGANPSADVAQSFIDYAAFAQVKGQGTLTVDKNRNPNKMIDLGVAAGGALSTYAAYYRLGATAKGESDQGFDQRQFFYGASAQVSKTELLFNSGTGTLIVNYGRVDPGKDSTRQTLVGNLKPFTRWDAEATYSMSLINKSENANTDWWLRPRVLALSYRHYQETGAPAAIKAAGKDRNRLGTIRVEFGNVAGQLQGSGGVVPFIQYARGSLPFDKSSDRSVTVGLTFTPPSTN